MTPWAKLVRGKDIGLRSDLTMRRWGVSFGPKVTKAPAYFLGLTRVTVALQKEPNG